jgi:RNA polymerase sigma factor (sigma-70 family)
MNEAIFSAEFLARLRAHEEAAAEQFVEVYGPVILQSIGDRLPRLGLSSVLDPEDIAQMVFRKFFAKLSGQIELASERDLVQLLGKMTRDQIRDEWRHAHAQRRGSGQHPAELSHPEEILSSGHEPNHDIIEQEELEQIHQHMTQEEWDLTLAWIYGKPWEELAKEFGQSADALRMKLTRALHRVRHDLKGKQDETSG